MGWMVGRQVSTTKEAPWVVQLRACAIPGTYRVASAIASTGRRCSAFYDNIIGGQTLMA